MDNYFLYLTKKYFITVSFCQTPVARSKDGAEEVEAEGLLQDPGRGPKRQRGGDQEGLQEAGHVPPPGQALGGHGAGEERT